MYVHKELKVMDLRESSCLEQGDTGCIFFLVSCETEIQRHQSRRAKQNKWKVQKGHREEEGA